MVALPKSFFPKKVPTTKAIFRHALRQGSSALSDSFVFRRIWSFCQAALSRLCLLSCDVQVLAGQIQAALCRGALRIDL